MTLHHLCLVALLCAAGCASSSSDVVRAELPARDTAEARRLNDRAFALIRSGRHDDALPLIEGALAADGEFGPALNNLGLVRLERGELYEAAVALRQASSAMPRQGEPLANLGLVLERVEVIPVSGGSVENVQANIR